jgi:hypothetical protein
MITLAFASWRTSSKTASAFALSHVDHLEIIVPYVCDRREIALLTPRADTSAALSPWQSPHFASKLPALIVFAHRQIVDWLLID